tara:strand:- start:232 stop:465 length:234 start_codon:yes stop_codon:yes gene_type:complete
MNSLQKLDDDLKTICNEVYELGVKNENLYIILYGINEDKKEQLDKFVGEYFENVLWYWEKAEFYNNNFKGNTLLTND